MKKFLSGILCLSLILGLLSGCGSSQPTETVQPQPAATEAPETLDASDDPLPPDAEIQKAIDLGFVPEALQGRYDSPITYAEFCGILDGFLSVLFPDSLEEWTPPKIIGMQKCR